MPLSPYSCCVLLLSYVKVVAVWVCAAVFVAVAFVLFAVLGCASPVLGRGQRRFVVFLFGVLVAFFLVQLVWLVSHRNM